MSLSSKVCPEIREYERLYHGGEYIKPQWKSILKVSNDSFAPEGKLPSIDDLCGGLTTLDTAKDYPIRLVESGPAGGKTSGTAFKRIARTLSVSFDMGGTTAKICLIDDGCANHSRSLK